MQYSPFRWLNSIDESKAEGGVFYGDSISDRWTSEGEAVVRPSRTQALEALQDWFSGANRKVPYLFGPYGIGKTSVLNYVIQQRMPGDSPPLIEIGVHGQPFSVEVMSVSIRQFASSFLVKQFEDGLSKEIQSLACEFWNPTADAQQLAGTILECDEVPKDSPLNDSALSVLQETLSNPWLTLTKALLRFCKRPFELWSLMEACRIEGPQCIDRFVKWARVQKLPPCVLVYGDPTLPATEGFSLTERGLSITAFDLFEKHNVPFLFELRDKTLPSEDNALPDTVLQRPRVANQPMTDYRFAKGLQEVRVPALRSEEALDCICGYHTRAQALRGIRPPRFCSERNTLPGSEGSCSRLPNSCRTARSVLNQTGTWPFLLQAVCFYWDEGCGEGVQGLEECLRKLKPTLWKHIAQWWSTLPEEEQSVFLSWLEGENRPTPDQYGRLSNLGMVFRVGKGRWIIPNLLKEWRGQSMKRKRVIRLDQPANDEVLNDLKEVLSSGQALAFIGNGCSIPVGYPSWRELICDLLDRCSKRQPLRASDFERMKRHPSPLFVAEGCKAVLGQEYYDFLSKEFGPRSPAFSDEHRILWRLFRQFLTSNYDPCLEHAFAEIYGKPADYFSHTNGDRMGRFPQEVNSEKQVIFHVHGHYDRSKECVLTESDYQKHYQDQGFLTTCTTLFQAHTVVFIGFSLEDELMGIPRRLTSIFQGSTGPHFAVLPYPADPGPWTKRQELRTKYRINAVFYPVTGDDHSARLRLLQSLIPPSATGMLSSPPHVP
ncbi:MAG: SIR2 family protein [Chloroflexi bacterium]|nr:SIR2 family protein [Chloroflexota bacterium]